MTQLEDQLRSAFRAKAGDITPPPPPLKLQHRPVLDPAARRGSGRAAALWQRRWLVPLAAAVAVLAVVAGALTVSGRVAGRGTPLGLPATTPIQTSVPPYYVSLTSVRPMPLRQPQAWPVLTTATVRATSTGAVIASIVPPQPYTEFIYVSAAADDRNFVLAAQYGGGPVQDGFFLLHINPTAADPAARATLTAIPAAALPYDDEVQAMALSPDGRLLATVVASSGAAPAYLHVYNLATGRSRTWTGADVQQGYVLAGNGGLSWTQGGRFLAFSSAPQSDRLRLLDVTARGHEVAPDSKPLATPDLSCGGRHCLTDVTPDGKMVFVEYDSGGMTPGEPTWENLVRFNMRTGTLTRINKLTVSGHGSRYVGYNPGAVVGPDDVLWTNYDGSQVIVADVRPGTPNAGIYNGSHYTPIPWPANIVGAAW
jgi:WD40 repeat protein